jgi:dGTP triphosphohydrolase
MLRAQNFLHEEGIMGKEIDRLKKILDENQQQMIYTCVRDLLTNGIVPERFNSGESLPSRQDVTHYILAWLKHVGVPADRCRNWIISYCERVLSKISSASASRIRHSTKSVIKYIYRSDDGSFDCGCEKNELKAVCDPNCPVYGEMKNKYATRMKKLHDAIHYVRREVEPADESLLQVKERHKDQFKKAMVVIEEQLNQVSSLDELTQYLNDHGHRTRTGRLWSVSTLQREIKTHNLTLSFPIDEKIRTYESKKVQYQEQYQEALQLIKKLVNESAKINEIREALEAKGYKTITGRTWTEGNIRNTVSKL